MREDKASANLLTVIEVVNHELRHWNRRGALSLGGEDRKYRGDGLTSHGRMVVYFGRVLVVYTSGLPDVLSVYADRLGKFSNDTVVYCAGKCVSGPWWEEIAEVQSEIATASRRLLSYITITKAEKDVAVAAAYAERVKAWLRK